MPLRPVASDVSGQSGLQVIFDPRCHVSFWSCACPHSSVPPHLRRCLAMWWGYVSLLSDLHCRPYRPRNVYVERTRPYDHSHHSGYVCSRREWKDLLSESIPPFRWCPEGLRRVSYVVLLPSVVTTRVTCPILIRWLCESTFRHNGVVADLLYSESLPYINKWWACFTIFDVSKSRSAVTLQAVKAQPPPITEETALSNHCVR